MTQLLLALRDGNRAAESQLVVLVYGELRRLAAHYLKRERPDHTLQPTALVNEAYLRLTKLQNIDWQSRAHFFATAANIMRRILVDHARAARTHKREAMTRANTIEELLIASVGRAPEFIALDEALDRLAKLDARQGRIVELRFFGGLGEDEVSIVLGVSPRTVSREWRLAKAWLYNELSASRQSIDA